MGVFVPTIHAFDSSAANSLGLEIMIIGRVLDAITSDEDIVAWRKDPSWHAARPLIQSIQTFIANLWQKDFSKIGSLYCD